MAGSSGIGGGRSIPRDAENCHEVIIEMPVPVVQTEDPAILDIEKKYVERAKRRLARKRMHETPSETSSVAP